MDSVQTNSTQVSREAALRIAIAARSLPDVSVGELLEVVINRIEGDITSESLASITVTDLKAGFASEDDSSIDISDIKEAVRILWGEADADSLPATNPAAADLPKSLRVAVASNSGEELNGHFGSCLRYLIYQMSLDKCELIDIRSALDADLAEDKNGFRTDLINDCHVLFVNSIGGPAAAKVVRSGVYPIKVKKACSAETELVKLQNIMGDSAPPWLAKILGVKAEDRIRFASEEID